MSGDPAGGVDGTVLYAYVRNNPVLFLDPAGTQSKAATDDTTVTIQKKATDYQQDPPKEGMIGMPPLSEEMGVPVPGAPNAPFANQAQGWSNMFSPVRGSPGPTHRYLTVDTDINFNAQGGGGSPGRTVAGSSLLSARLNLPQAEFAGGRWLLSSQLGALGSLGPQAQTGSPTSTLITGGLTLSTGVSSAHWSFAAFAQGASSGTLGGAQGGAPSTPTTTVTPNATSGVAGSLTGIVQLKPDDRNTLIANPVVGKGNAGSYLNTQPYGPYSSLGGILAWQHLVGDTADQNSVNFEAGYSRTLATPLTTGESTREDRPFLGAGFSHQGSNYVVSGNVDVFGGFTGGGAQNPAGVSVLSTLTLGVRLPLYTPATCTVAPHDHLLEERNDSMQSDQGTSSSANEGSVATLEA